MEKEKEIKGCFHVCPFFGTSMDGMECKHPHWDDKGAYENMIINQDNSRNGNVPLRCPLRTEPLVITYKLESDKKI